MQAHKLDAKVQMKQRHFIGIFTVETGCGFENRDEDVDREWFDHRAVVAAALAAAAAGASQPRAASLPFIGCDLGHQRHHCPFIRPSIHANAPIQAAPAFLFYPPDDCTLIGNDASLTRAECFRKVRSISPSAVSAQQLHQRFSTSAHQQHQCISNSSASAASMHQHHQCISSIITSVYQQHQRISSSSASAV